MIAEAVLCLALNVFHEARGEPWEGRLAVALVVRNRAEKYGTSICWETFRDSQFSWTSDVSKLRTLPTGDKWDEAIVVARIVVAGTADITRGADHYHTVSVRPRWSRDPRMKRIGVWGSHAFYQMTP